MGQSAEGMAVKEGEMLRRSEGRRVGVGIAFGYRRMAGTEGQKVRRLEVEPSTSSDESKVGRR